MLILTPIWRRPEVTEIYFRGLRRIREHRGSIKVLAIISEDSYKPLCQRYDVPYTFFYNQPLGRKKNHGLREALKLDWDYLMELNSDDIVKNDLIDLYETLDYDYCGLRNFLFINGRTGECRQVQDKTIYGIGRRYSRRLIERVGDLWNDEGMAGMDNHANWKIWQETRVEGKQIFTDEPLAADIKTEINIWPFNPELGTKYPLEDFMDGLSEDEINLINGLSNKNTA